MIILKIIRFVIFILALLSSIFWLTTFISDLITPNMKYDEKTGEVKAYARESRFWSILFAVVLWGVLFAFL